MNQYLPTAKREISPRMAEIWGIGKMADARRRIVGDGGKICDLREAIVGPMPVKKCLR